MIETITTAVAAAPDTGTRHDAKDKGASNAVATPAAGGPGAPMADEAAAKPKPSTRLLIDQDKATGDFVYRIVDAHTGRLLQEIPRQSVEDLKNATDYVAGALIVTDA